MSVLLNRSKAFDVVLEEGADGTATITSAVLTKALLGPAHAPGFLVMDFNFMIQITDLDDATSASIQILGPGDMWSDHSTGLTTGDIRVLNGLGGQAWKAVRVVFHDGSGDGRAMCTATRKAGIV